MTKLKKWNSKKRIYEDFETPAKKPKLIAELDEIVNCAECGKEVVFGKCYTSRLIHNHIGFGYAVCEDCYYKEIKLN